MDYSRPDLADRLAAEYAAGTLRGAARRRLEALLPAHPVLRSAVQRWQERLAPLTVSVPPEQPSPEVWRRIVARIDGAAMAPPSRWWARLGVWRGVSAAATVAALALAVVLANPPPAQPPIVVVMNPVAPPAGAAAGAVTPASFVASISGDGRAVVTRPLANVSLQPDRVLELWAIAGTQAPRSLGLISPSGVSVVRRGQLPAGTDTLAVSLEPPGGSPSGAPTGPVLYAGSLRN